MSNIQHFPNISYVSANFRVEIRLDRFSKQFADAQQWLGDRVLEGCEPFMPKQTGSLEQRSCVLNGGKQVLFPGPYARFLYGGKVMVDRVTGKGPRKIPMGPGGDYILRFEEGAKLVPSNRRLTYSTSRNPQATDHWFDSAKAQHGEYWISEVKKMAGGG